MVNQGMIVVHKVMNASCLASLSFRLQRLNLANNQLTTSDLEALNTVSALTSLDLSGNPITSIPYRLLSFMGMLKTLTFQNCGVEIIDPNAFVDIKDSLESLDLADNFIASLKRETFQPMGSQFFGLALKNNPIRCDCGTKQFQDWLSDLTPALDDAQCTASDGTIYNIKTDDLTRFCESEVRCFVGLRCHFRNLANKCYVIFCVRTMSSEVQK